MARIVDSSAIGFCDVHQKLLYTGRKPARKSAQCNGRDGMRPYRCDAVDGMWHLGHLPPNVRKGKLTAGEAFGR